jgi:anti-sigma factor RsiW
MNRCDRVYELLFDYVADGLDPADRALVAGHLDDCPSCDAYLDSYRKAVLLARRLPEEPPPPELLQRLLAALEEGAGGAS